MAFLFAKDQHPILLAPQELHLQVALAAIGGEDSGDAIHHLKHYLETTTGNGKTIAEEAIELLEHGRFRDAEHEIEEILHDTEHEVEELH